MSHPAAVAIATAHPGAVPDLVRRLAPATCRHARFPVAALRRMAGRAGGRRRVPR